jgi:selenoprotein W-related protein
VDKTGSRIDIRHCRQCGWLLRATWMAQELLTSFEQEIKEVSLSPDTGGIFEVRGDGGLVWSRKDKGRFPDIKELKNIVRNIAAPDKDLGHSEIE